MQDAPIKNIVGFAYRNKDIFNDEKLLCNVTILSQKQK